MHHANTHPDGTLDVIAGKCTTRPGSHILCGVSYCEGGGAILSSQWDKYMWTIDSPRAGIVPVPVNNIYSACASDTSPNGRIYAISLRTADREYTTYGCEGSVISAEIPSIFTNVNGDGTRIYYAGDQISYVDVASQRDVRLQPESGYGHIRPEATRGPLVYYDSDIATIIECDTRSGVMTDTDMSIVNLGSVRCMGDCLIAHRKILWYNGYGTQIMGERIVAYDLRNRAEYDIDEYTPYEYTHFYI